MLLAESKAAVGDLVVMDGFISAQRIGSDTGIVSNTIREDEITAQVRRQSRIVYR
jgi:hypothetical protein